MVLQSTDLLSLVEQLRTYFLFHTTTAENLLSILEEGTLHLGRMEPSVSFSRSNVRWGKASRNKVRLVFNGEKLYNDYKIQPHVFQYDENPTKFQKVPGGYFEYELRTNRPVRNIRRYLVGIEIFSTFVDQDWLHAELYPLLEHKYPGVKVYFHQEYLGDPPRKDQRGYKPHRIDKQYREYLLGLDDAYQFSQYQNGLQIDEVYVGLLYRSTKIDRLMKDLKNHAIGYPSSTHHVALTRNPNLWFNLSSYPVRLVLDGDRLGRDYKLEPYTGGKDYQKPNPDYEYEIAVKNRFIKNLERYLVAIQIDRSHYHEIKNSIDDLLHRERYPDTVLIQPLPAKRTDDYRGGTTNLTYANSQTYIEQKDASSALNMISPYRHPLTPRHQYRLGDTAKVPVPFVPREKRSQHPSAASSGLNFSVKDIMADAKALDAIDDWEPDTSSSIYDKPPPQTTSSHNPFDYFPKEEKKPSTGTIYGVHVLLYVSLKGTQVSTGSEEDFTLDGEVIRHSKSLENTEQYRYLLVYDNQKSTATAFQSYNNALHILKKKNIHLAIVQLLELKETKPQVFFIQHILQEDEF